VSDLGDALRGKLAHDDLSHYNGVQKLFYAGAIVALILVVLSGLAIWKPVQLWWLAAAFGGFQGARLVHFVAMAAIVGFLVVHVVMALIVPKTIRAMVFGR
jgi:thiosulfate reductase cytochrome b subunit